MVLLSSLSGSCAQTNYVMSEKSKVVFHKKTKLFFVTQYICWTTV